LEYEHMEPPPGADPGSPAVRRQGRSRARRQATSLDSNQESLGNEFGPTATDRRTDAVAVGADDVAFSDFS